MQHALAVDDLFFGLERLATDAIPAGVGLGVEVIRRTLEDALDQRTDADLVLFASGTHEAIVRDSERGPRFLKSACDLIDLCLRTSGLPWPRTARPSDRARPFR